MQDVILKLEEIRDDQRDKYRQHLRGRVRMGASEIKGSKWLMGQQPFVKEVIGLDARGGMIKKPVVGKKSFAEAVGTGARGVYRYFSLHHAGCYLIREQQSRRRCKTYYAIVADGRLMEVSPDRARDYVASTTITREIRL